MLQSQNYLYNYQSFKGVNIASKNKAVHTITNPSTLRKYIEHANSLENLKIDLTKIVKSWKLTPSMIYVLKNFFNTIGENETSNFTVDFEDYKNNNIVSFIEPDHEASDSIKSYYIPIQKSFWGYFVNASDDNKKSYLPGIFKHYENFRLPTEKLILSVVNKILKADIESVAHVVDERCARMQNYEELEEIRNKNLLSKKRIDYLKLYPEKLFPVSSLVCTIDDILAYMDKHKKWNDYEQVYKIDDEAFNNPVTIDGESLLIALAHVLPSAENAVKYENLIDRLSRCYIDFNQKDSMGISFIEHVLNSQNRFLLTLIGFHYARNGLGGAYNSYYGLRYEPALENVFNNIRDEDFKNLVLKLDLFNNMYNLKYNTIFGQPNPKL